jgi:hypothetical protein
MDKDAYIKKLERRIHNQRVALRENWMIVDERAKGRTHYYKPFWFQKYLEKAKECYKLKKTVSSLRTNN